MALSEAIKHCFKRWIEILDESFVQLDDGGMTQPDLEETGVGR
jgi:hypothetical protein